MTRALPSRPSGPGRRLLPWAVAAVVLATSGLGLAPAAAHYVRLAPQVGVARPISPSLVTNASFNVDLTDTPSFAPAFLSVTANGTTNVSIHLTNIGTIPHTFTLVNQSGVKLNRSWTPGQLYAFFTANGSAANVNLTGGQSGWANVSFPANTTLRSFEFVSTLPYQFQAGMFGFLNLTPAGPAVVLSENTTNNFQFVPSILSAGPTARGVTSLHVMITNLGDFNHTFTVAPQANVTLTSANYFSNHTPLVNVSVPAASGAVVWANFTVPASGVYEYICTITGHFEDGMYGFLYVGVPVPVQATPSTAIVEIWVLVGSGALVGIGVALAAASAYVGRIPRAPGGHAPHA